MLRAMSAAESPVSGIAMASWTTMRWVLSALRTWNVGKTTGFLLGVWGFGVRLLWPSIKERPGSIVGSDQTKPQRIIRVVTCCMGAIIVTAFVVWWVALMLALAAIVILHGVVAAESDEGVENAIPPFEDEVHDSDRHGADRAGRGIIT